MRRLEGMLCIQHNISVHVESGKLLGKPCPHALAVITTLRQPNMEMYVHNYYSIQKFQAAYQGIIPSITDRGQWPEVDKGFKLFPPNMKKRDPGRQKKKRHLGPPERSGKATRHVKCPACSEYGHMRGSWRCSLTGTKKRKGTKKAAPKPRRKKKTDPIPSGENTLRTRLALAKEAAAKATREAQDAAAKASAAAEAAATAERQIMPLPVNEVGHASASTTATRRNLCWDLQVINEVDEPPSASVEPAPKKMTPRKKQLATKVRKSPVKKGKK